jgi:hypothetical protein
MKKVGGLKERLQEDLSKGSVNISSSDVADFGTDEKHEPVQGDVVTKVPDEAKKDTMINRAADGEPGRELDKNTEETAGDYEAATDMTGSRYAALPEEVTITQKEREQFLDVLVKGGRFSLPFKLFNGRVSGSFRSRTQLESQAIINQVNRECREEKVVNPLDYSTRLRNMLLAAQVGELNGDSFPPLKEPLMRVVEGEDTTDPGWLNQVELWTGKDEGLVSAIYRELQIFERKYWTMVNNARDQNFWNPAESTLR